MKKIKEGDIFEIKTSRGRAYLHYIYLDTTGIELIRILPGRYEDRPVNFDTLATKPEKYMVSFPLAAANRRKIVEKVGYYSSQDFKKPPFMRTEHNVRGEFLGWHIVNTNTLQRELVKHLSSAHKKLSPWGIWNDTLLIENIINDWDLEKWE